MPFNYPMAGLGAWSQPPRGLGFGDLYRPSPRPTYPAEPDWIDDVGDLGDEDRKRLRRQAILRLAMVLGGDPGQWGQGFAVAGAQSGDFRQGLIQEARARQEEQYGRSRQRAEETFESERFAASEEERATKIRALISMRDQVVAADPSLRQRAEAALAAQDGAALRNLLGSLSERQSYRARGLDPDDPFSQRQAELDMQTVEEAERRKAELADLPRELELRSGADIEEEKRKRALGLGSYYTSPSELMNAQAGRMPKTVEVGDTLYQIGPDIDPLTGKIRIQELAQAKEKAGKVQLVRDAYGSFRHGKFDPATGQVSPVTMEEWKELKAAAEAAKVPPDAPLVRKPSKAPKGSADPSGFAPRASQVTSPKNAPAGPGGTLRPVPKGLAKPRTPGAEQSLDPGLVKDVRDDLPRGEEYIRSIMRQNGYSDSEIERYLTAARSQ